MQTSPDDARFPGAWVSNLALLAGAAFAFLALRRYATYHNETFDLAFYARLVWGLGHWDQYQPLTNSNFWGLHASPVLYPLGWLARVLPLVPLMLVVQAAAVAAAGIPLARIAARRAGHPVAAFAALGAYLLYPSIATLATYEFHPSALALFPLALALDAFDRREIRRGLIALAVAVTCREDVALIAGFMGLSLALRPEHRRAGLGLFAAGTLYFAYYLFVVAPRHLPAHGSLQLHYGALGGSPAGVARALVLHPLATLRLVATPAKLLYAPRLLVPVAFLSLLAPRWLIPALVPFGINFLSGFPTAVQIQSHYSALAVPFLLASAAHGAGRLAASSRQNGERYLALAGAAVALGSLWMQHRAGATPLSRRWDAGAFRRDARTAECEELMRLVPPEVGFAGPDYTLPHAAGRAIIQRIPWTLAEPYVLLSLEYRDRFGATQELWRSTEEVLVRNTLAGARYGVFAVAGRHVLMRRGWPVRAWASGRYVDFAPDEGVVRHHVDVGARLAVAGYAVRGAPGGSVVRLYLLARGRWPGDLGFELGYGAMHPAGDRQDPEHIVAALPFDGLFSPAHVRVGEVVRTDIALPLSPEEVRATGLYFGARRVDGSRLDPESAHWTPLGNEGDAVGAGRE